MGYVEVVTIELDKARSFRVSFGTIRRFQRQTGKTFRQLAEMMTGLQADDTSVDEGEVIDLLGALVWAGCSGEDSSLTIDDVFEHLALDPSEQLAPVFEAIGRAMPEATEDTPLANGTNPSRGGRRAGNQSGPSPGLN